MIKTTRPSLQDKFLSYYNMEFTKQIFKSGSNSTLDICAKSTCINEKATTEFIFIREQD
jgi:hypothetical protein